MTIEQIECFVAVASTGSISQAAARLFRSQPNLSYLIKQLEADLGYPLLIRSNQGALLTPEGEIFLRQAQRTLEDFQQLRNFSIVQDPEETPALRLAAMPFCGVSQALATLLNRQQKPFRQIVINQCMRNDLIAGLAERKYDLGVCYIYPTTQRAVRAQLESNGLILHELTKCVPCALVGRGVDWFQDPIPRVTAQRLNKLYRVFFAREGMMSFSSTQYRSLSDCAGRILAGDQLDLQAILHSLPSFSLVPCSKALLQSGGTIMEGLRCVPINGHDMVGAYYAVHRRQQPPSGLEVQLLEVLWNQLNGWN